ncbi:tRNA-specific adenosine deaminase [Candidatus Gugararchaeum adminiculabundum]|nr:tRNA-specific adenosine deaminase [Candidatus Gugararchaeum adminiculabundum]
MNFMQLAAREALLGMNSNHGGPFGAVIVKKGKIIAKAHNTVLKTKDPSAHAEVNAIRKASKKLKTFDLSDCEIYASCQPCPMCLGAIMWARIPVLYIGCTSADAASIGFDDKKFYDDFKKNGGSSLKSISDVDREECLKVMKKWLSKKDKVPY